MSEFSAGQEFKHGYPFIREPYAEQDEEGTSKRMSWRPGVRHEVSGYWGDESNPVADGKGQQILTVIDVHKPGRFPTRVFYTVAWVDPDGRKFGKGKLHIATIDKFRRRSRGFLFAYEVALSEVAA